MNIYVDAEFNGWKGQLLSIGLVSGDDEVWYKTFPCTEVLDPWVKDNVVPLLYVTPESTKSLYSYLSPYKSINVIADWPDDIAYFCNLLVTGAGEMIETPCMTFELITTLPGTALHSSIPHNALHDAIALRGLYRKSV